MNNDSQETKDRHAASLAEMVFDEATIRSMTYCAERKYYVSRNLRGVVATVEEFGGHVPTVLASLGWLPRVFSIESKYVDLLNPDGGVSELSDDPRVQAGLILFRRVAELDGPIPNMVMPLTPAPDRRHHVITELGERLQQELEQ